MNTYKRRTFRLRKKAFYKEFRIFIAAMITFSVGWIGAIIVNLFLHYLL